MCSLTAFQVHGRDTGLDQLGLYGVDQLGLCGVDQLRLCGVEQLRLCGVDQLQLCGVELHLRVSFSRCWGVWNGPSQLGLSFRLLLVFFVVIHVKYITVNTPI